MKSRPRPRLKLPTKSNRSAPAVLNSPACSKSSTPQHQLLLCHGRRNQTKRILGQRLRWRWHQRRQAQGKRRQQINSALNLVLSRCGGVSTISRRLRHHILNLPSPRDTRLRPVLLLTSQNRLIPHPLANRHLGHAKDMVRWSQAHGHPRQTVPPASFAVDLPVIVRCKMDPSRHFPLILIPKTRQRSVSAHRPRQVQAQAGR